MVMTTRSTARRVLRSDTAPERRVLELEAGNCNDNVDNVADHDRSALRQQLHQLETGIADIRQEFAASQNHLRVEVTAELTNLNSSIGNEMTEIKGHLANLVQAMTNMSTTLSQTQATAQAAQQIAVEVREQTAIQQPRITESDSIPSQAQISTTQQEVGEIQQVQDVQMTTQNDNIGTFPSTSVMRGLRLRKMGVSPPRFDGIIDGIKLNSFVFQFESYFQQKGYSLTHHDHLLPHELNQCVRKNALIWYERFMTDDTTTKLWSITKSEMIREFREPNFQAKVRSKLLKMKQTGAYHGYVNKFRKLQSFKLLEVIHPFQELLGLHQRTWPIPS